MSQMKPDTWPMTVEDLIELLEEVDGNKRVSVDKPGFGVVKSLNVTRETVALSESWE